MSALRKCSEAFSRIAVLSNFRTTEAKLRCERGPNGAEFVVEGKRSIYCVIGTHLRSTSKTCAFI
jgi:hypothetical protein